MRKTFITVAIVFILVSVPAYAETSRNMTVTNHLRAGDRAYRNFNNDSALKAYQNAAQIDSLNYTAAWKLARAYVDVGELQPEKKQRKYILQKQSTLLTGQLQSHLIASKATFS